MDAVPELLVLQQLLHCNRGQDPGLQLAGAAFCPCIGPAWPAMLLSCCGRGVAAQRLRPMRQGHRQHRQCCAPDCCWPGGIQGRLDGDIAALWPGLQEQVVRGRCCHRCCQQLKGTLRHRRAAVCCSPGEPKSGADAGPSLGPLSCWHCLRDALQQCQCLAHRCFAVPVLRAPELPWDQHMPHGGRQQRPSRGRAVTVPRLGLQQCGGKLQGFHPRCIASALQLGSQQLQPGASMHGLQQLATLAAAAAVCNMLHS